MKIKRMYEVRRVTGPHTIIERKYNKKTKQFEDVPRVVQEHFIVAFPQGHSTAFETEAQMLKAGIAPNAGLVDMETGIRVSPELAVQFSRSLHDIVDSDARRISANSRHVETFDVTALNGEGA